jgi:hypothetical protein
VIAGAAIDAVPGFTILDGVIPAVARQSVTAGVAAQRIVTGIAVHHVLAIAAADVVRLPGDG